MDPLRPFADSIRALWQARAGNARSGASAAPGATRAASHTRQRMQALHSEEALRARLKARLSQIDIHDPRKVREAFVATVLLWDLGDRLGQDAGFGEMVMYIADQLAAHAAVDSRLQQLVARLS